MQQKIPFASIPTRKDDIKVLPLYQLNERLARQEKLLANTGFLTRLPDKGAKLVRHAEQLRAAISSRQLVESATRQLEEMTLGGASAAVGAEEPQPMLLRSRREPLGASAVRGAEEPTPMLLQSHQEPFTRATADRSSTEGPNPTSASERHPSASNTTSTSPPSSMGKAKPRAAAAAAAGVDDRRRRPGKSLAAVKERIVHSAPKTSKQLTLEESANLLQSQEKHTKELEKKYATERLRLLVGKHDVGPLPDTSSASFRTHRSSGGDALASKSVGDHHMEQLESVGRQFVDGPLAESDSDDADDDDGGDAGLELEDAGGDLDEVD